MNAVNIKVFTSALCLAASLVVTTSASAQDTKHYRFAHDQQLNSGYSVAYDIFSAKLKALLAIAGKVQQGGKNVLPADIDRARQEGATDREIHDAVLIAAAFCMYNRYVDGLATWAPRDAAAYRPMGARMAEVGYIREDPPAARVQSTTK